MLEDPESIAMEHGPLVWRTVYRLLGDEADAADAMQAAFLNAIEVAGRLSVASWLALLQRVATRRALDLLRRRAREKAIVPLPDEAAATARGPTDHLFVGELRGQLRMAIAMLPEQQGTGFEITGGNHTLRTWIDSDTHLPLLAESTYVQRTAPNSTVTISDFRWNEPVDDSLLSMEPPPGYQLTSVNTGSFQPTEQDPIDALGHAAGLLGGHFPKAFDSRGLAESLGFQAGTYFGRPDELKKFQERQAKVMPLMSKAWAFIDDPKSGSDFTYTGKGEYWGTPAAVLWYRPAASQNYRVIDASLKVREVTAAELPRIEPQKLGK